MEDTQIMDFTQDIDEDLEDVTNSIVSFKIIIVCLLNKPLGVGGIRIQFLPHRLCVVRND